MSAKHFVPPGQEDLVAAMLGRGETVGPGCTLVRVDMAPAEVTGTYECAAPTGEVAVTLAHPESIDFAAFRTRELAARARGDVPAALLVALRARIEEREGGWRWVTASTGEADSNVRPSGQAWAPLAASGVAMLVVFGLACARRFG